MVLVLELFLQSAQEKLGSDVMPYKTNPKLAGSGIVGCIPQDGPCPYKCPDCYYQSGRGYNPDLVSNMPPSDWRVVRVNEGNDSNNQRDLVIERTLGYNHKFYDSSVPVHIPDFPGPIVITVNPGKMRDVAFHKIKDPIPDNLMFVRVLATTWNKSIRDKAIEYYTSRKVPVVLTWFRFWETAYEMPEQDWCAYEYRKHVTNEYWAIKNWAWKIEMEQYENNDYVFSCGKAEGEGHDSRCRFCGNCLREYFTTLERMETGERV